MQTTTLEVIETNNTSEESDLVHICCDFCNPLKAFCGADLVGHHWVANCKPEDECVVCGDIERTTPHICKDGFNWHSGDYNDD